MLRMIRINGHDGHRVRACLSRTSAHRILLTNLIDWATHRVFETANVFWLWAASHWVGEELGESRTLASAWRVAMDNVISFQVMVSSRVCMSRVSMMAQVFCGANLRRAGTRVLFVMKNIEAHSGISKLKGNIGRNSIALYTLRYRNSDHAPWLGLCWDLHIRWREPAKRRKIRNYWKQSVDGYLQFIQTLKEITRSTFLQAFMIWRSRHSVVRKS